MAVQDTGDGTPPNAPARQAAPSPGTASLPASLLGSVRLLGAAHWQLLILLGVASFFEGYDFNIITVALKPLRESFGIDQATASAWIAVVYLGGLPAVVAARRADRHGRRAMLLLALVGYSVMTAATAAATSIEIFVAVQFAARFFLVT